MIELGDVDSKIHWLLINGGRLNWHDQDSPYYEFYEALQKRCCHTNSKKDLETICVWTSGRIAEGYAFLLEPLNNKNNSSWHQLELLGDICESIRRELSNLN